MFTRHSSAHIQIFFILGSLKWSVTAHCLPSHPAPARTNTTKLKIIEKEARSKAQTPAELGAVMVAVCPADNVLSLSLPLTGLIEYCWSALCLVSGHLTDLTDLTDEVTRNVYI